MPQRIFDGTVMKYDGNIYVRYFTCCNHLLIIMFGQLSNRDSLRDLNSTISAHFTKNYHLDFGKNVTRTNMAKVSERRESRIFEDFAYHMIDIMRKKRIKKDFEIYGKVFVFNSTSIDLYLSIFWWAKFRRTKADIKLYTLHVIDMGIPSFINITDAKMHDQWAMGVIPYEQGAYYVFDRGYFDIKRLYHINEIEAFFVIRQRGNLLYDIIKDSDNMHNVDGVLSDQIFKLTGYQTMKKYPVSLRRIRYYAADKNKIFVYLTNNMQIPAMQVALLYKFDGMWNSFFMINQHLKIKSFWGMTGTAVRIQIYSAFTAYCIVAIIEHDLNLHRSTHEVFRILSASLLDKTPIKKLFINKSEYVADDGQFSLNFLMDTNDTL